MNDRIQRTLLILVEQGIEMASAFIALAQTSRDCEANARRLQRAIKIYERMRALVAEWLPAQRKLLQALDDQKARCDDMRLR